MKFQKKLILLFAIVSMVSSTLAGLVVYRLSVLNSESGTRANLKVTSSQVINQMNEKFAQMDAVMNYVLSDVDLLDSIQLLGRDDSSVPSSYVTNARTTLRYGLSTDFITRNKYLTVFFNNKDIYLASPWLSKEKLVDSFDFQGIPYVDAADAALGKTVIINRHKNFWIEDSGSEEVFSVIKALQGPNMGYLEVDNSAESLKELNQADPTLNLLLYVNGDELLYATDQSLDTEEYRALALNESADNKVTAHGTYYVGVARSDQYAVTAVVVKSQRLSSVELQRIVKTSIGIAVLVFVVSLAMVILSSFLISRPIREMRRVIEETSLENLDSADVSSVMASNDEIQDLLNSYQMMIRRLDMAIAKEKKASILQVEALYDSLQAQINPHFFYNVLNVISARGVLDDDEMICEICGALASMLRYSTGNKVRYTTVKEEVEYLQQYRYLLKARFDDRIAIDIYMDEAVKGQIIPKMALQQIVENSVNHGYHQTVSLMKIEITGRTDGDGWKIRVRDNGSGFDKESLKRVQGTIQDIRKKLSSSHENIELEIGGLGLVNTYARCKLLFGDQTIFEVGNRNDGIAGAEIVIGSRRSFTKDEIDEALGYHDVEEG